MSLEIKVVDQNNKDLHFLISKLDKDLMRRYPNEKIYGIDFSDPKVKDITFIVSYYDRIPVGCGAIRPLDSDSVELKRFFVDDSFRKKGIASQMLSFLENKARESGYLKIKLETGHKQPEAISLYKKCGYYEIDLFGEYTDCKYSTCFEKKI